jgi:hypothetical protein
MSKSPFYNPKPQDKFPTLNALREAMTLENPNGDAYLNYLLEGEYFAGKTLWTSNNPSSRAAYQAIMQANPELITESAYSEKNHDKSVREQGQNKIELCCINSATAEQKKQLEVYQRAVSNKSIPPKVIFSGGPAAKIAAILLELTNKKNKKYDCEFFLDFAEKSNESGSASYEHIHHANALNAETDNTGMGILRSAIKRALVGESDPSIALNTDYKKVDLWPKAVRFKDLPIYLINEWDTFVQTMRKRFGLQTSHDKSRIASKLSTEILSYLEDELNCQFRLKQDPSRAIFLYYTTEQHKEAKKENRRLTKRIGLYPEPLSAEQLVSLYGESTLKHIVAADVFHENSCLRHGFDQICKRVLTDAGGQYHEGMLIKKVYLDQDGKRAVAILLEDLRNRETHFTPLSYLALSLGPSATYHFPAPQSLWEKLCDKFLLRQAVPHQTIASGLSCQLLFRINDPVKFKTLAHTGLKQAHFTEIGSDGKHIIIKLTSGGMIGLPVYSRSYGICALANLLRALGPDSGLTFIDVMSAYPCTRAINGTNNGELLLLADNFVLRYGEGGTGMSKMASNAQTFMQALKLEINLPKQLQIEKRLYQHTIKDRRKIVQQRLKQQGQ